MKNDIERENEVAAEAEKDKENDLQVNQRTMGRAVATAIDINQVIIRIMKGNILQSLNITPRIKAKAAKPPQNKM